MSLRARLLLAVGAVALVALLAADVATYSSLHSFLYQRIDQQLDDAHQPIEQQLEGRGQAGVGGGIYAEVRDAADHSTGSSSYFDFRRGQRYTPKLPGHITDLRTNGPGDAHRYFTADSVQPGGPSFRVRASSLPGGGQLIIGLPLRETNATLHRLLLIELGVTGGALFAAVLLGFWLVRVGMRPLAEVEATAMAIADGQMDRRVPGEESNTEVGRLARSLNIMLSRIQAAFAQRDATEVKLRRFVADASHELRTPLAAVSAYAELFERGASSRPGDLARVMSGIRTETGRMGGLVEDLLLLARLDEGRPLERAPVELTDLASEAVTAATVVGPEWPVRIDAAGPVEIVGDAARLRQVVDNLLANVRAHTPASTTATVRVAVEDGSAVVAVADNGPGLSAEEAGQAFERFYRADPSRSREHGGAGLGLAIVVAIVAAHGGSVALTETDGGGATFTIRLPLPLPTA